MHQKIAHKSKVANHYPINKFFVAVTVSVGTAATLYYSPRVVDTLKSLASYAVSSPTILSASGCLVFAGVLSALDDKVRRTTDELKAIPIAASIFFTVGHLLKFIISEAIYYVPILASYIASIVTYLISSPLIYSLYFLFLGLGASDKPSDKGPSLKIPCLVGSALFYGLYWLGVVLFNTSSSNVEIFLNEFFPQTLSRILMALGYYMASFLLVLSIAEPSHMLRILLSDLRSLLGMD